MYKILCIGAHNDEIMADMGGTACLLQRAGCQVRILALACQWNDDTFDDATKDEYRRQEFAAAAELGCEFKVLGNRDDLLYLACKEYIDELAREILEFLPDIVFIHPPKDNHVEHRECAQVSLKALCVAHVRGARYKEIYAFDTGIMQSMDYFRPDFFVDVAETMDTVKKSLMHFQQNHALGEHLCQSYEHKRAYRGRCGGVSKGEAFKIVKFPNGSDDFLLKQLLGGKFRWYGNGMYPAFGEEYF